MSSALVILHWSPDREIEFRHSQTYLLTIARTRFSFVFSVCTKCEHSCAAL